MTQHNDDAATRQRYAPLIASLEVLGEGTPVDMDPFLKRQGVKIEGFLDPDTQQTVQVCWRNRTLRWTPVPVNQYDTPDFGPWIPLPEVPLPGKYPWRTT